MKVTSHVNTWGIPVLEIHGETDHENSLLELCARRGVTGSSIRHVASTSEPDRASYRLEFGLADGTQQQKPSSLQGEFTADNTQVAN